MEIQKATKTIKGKPIDWELKQHEYKWTRNKKPKQYLRIPSHLKSQVRSLLLLITVIYYLGALITVLFVHFVADSSYYESILGLFFIGLVLILLNGYLVMHRTFDVTTELNRQMVYLKSAILSFVVILILNTVSSCLVVNKMGQWFKSNIEMDVDHALVFLVVTSEVSIVLITLSVLRAIEELKKNMQISVTMGVSCNTAFESRSFLKYWKVPSQSSLPTQTVISRNVNVMESPYPWAYKQANNAKSVFDYC